MNRVAIAVAAVVAMAMGAQQVAAASVDDGTVSIRVRFSDLDLQHTDGAKAMLARLAAASEDACGPAPSIADLGRLSTFNHCVEQTLGEAVQSLQAPMVTAAFEGQRGDEARIASAAPDR